jgi:Flp pilus assembly protein TadB
MSASAAALALAGAVLASAPRSGSGRLRAMATGTGATPPAAPHGPLRPVAGAVVGGVLGGAVGGAVWIAALCAVAGFGLGLAAGRWAGGAGPPDDDPAELSAAWAQLAVCLEVGLPVAAAVGAAAVPLRGRAGTELRRVAGLLELGADPVQAWSAAARLPRLAAFARAAGRSAATGAALARAARAEGTRLQDRLTDLAEARAQRAAVLVTAPLGVCFLPAFLVLGIAPVVIGLAARSLAWW